jgi:hypothetical protein
MSPYDYRTKKAFPSDLQQIKRWDGTLLPGCRGQSAASSRLFVLFFIFPGHAPKKAFGLTAHL